jgi:hypothetical protein
MKYSTDADAGYREVLVHRVTEMQDATAFFSLALDEILHEDKASWGLACLWRDNVSRSSVRAVEAFIRWFK